MVEIGGQPNLQLSVLGLRDIVQSKIRAVLIDDPPPVLSSALRVETLVLRELFSPLPILIARPEVHHPVLIADEIQSPLEPHRIFARARVVGRQRDRLFASIEAPEILRRSPFVALGMTGLLL